MASMDIPDRLAATLRRVLGEIESNPDAGGFARTRRASFRVPVPYPSPVPAWLVRVLLGMVLEIPMFGRDEKLAWEFVLRFRGVPMTLASEKFGLRGYVDAQAVDGEEAAKELVDDLMSCLQRAVPPVEKYLLRDLLSEQLNGGHATVQNVYGRLRRAYEHFRRRSENLAVPQSEPSEVVDRQPSVAATASEPEGVFGEAIFSSRARAWESREATRFDQAAAVSAYMSALEHLLVIAFAFSGLDPANGQLERFIGSTWRDKMRDLVDLDDRSAKRCYDSLIQLVEEVRNPAAHGGFDHVRSLIYFHIPGLGAVPVQMSRAGYPNHFLFTPEPEDPGFSPWAVLDAVDRWLEQGQLRFAYRYALSGLDTSFDPSFRREIRAATKDDEEFGHFLDGVTRFVDDATNMDW